jgi:hypothetical protein
MSEGANKPLGPGKDVQGLNRDPEIPTEDAAQLQSDEAKARRPSAYEGGRAPYRPGQTIAGSKAAAAQVNHAV